MFVVFLRFSGNRDRAGALMAGHKAWLDRGFEDGVFLVAGGLGAGEGGAILAHDTGLRELERRLGEDPFVAEDVVRAEITEVAPSRTDARLRFLVA